MMIVITGNSSIVQTFLKAINSGVSRYDIKQSAEQKEEELASRR
jgi:hypothetical protein